MAMDAGNWLSANAQQMDTENNNYQMTIISSSVN